jgi:CBS domain-containing protein
MLVLELMKTHVVTVGSDALLGEAVDLMDLYQTSGIPVVTEAGDLCGFLTENDVFRACTTPRTDALNGYSLRGDAAEIKVADVMTPEVCFVRDTDDAQTAAQQLMDRGFRTLPVVTEEGKVIGTLNRVDILQAFWERLISFSREVMSCREHP